MLSIGKLAAGQQQHYLNAVAQGVEDYYSLRGEVPGRWLGGGTAEVGLSGRVLEADLHAVLLGLHPQTLERLARGNRRLPGFDLTFSAPKSVSLVWALGSESVAAEVVAAHEAAVDASVRWMEAVAARGRRGHNGVCSVDTTGFVAAGFRHRTSRAGDPQLHTHVLVANMARGTDGRWGALDGRQLYVHARTAGALYRAELRAELTRRLGLEWTQPVDGIAEVAGIPKPVLRAFSRRRQEIEAALAARGLEGRRAAQVAALDTRKSKDYGVDGESLKVEWLARAAELGFDAFDLKLLLDSLNTRVVSPPVSPDMRALGAELTAHDATFGRREVLQALATAAIDGAPIAELERQAEEFLWSPQVVAVGRDRFSTVEQVELETRLLDGAVGRLDDGVGVADANSLDAALQRRPELSREQVRMVRVLTTSGAGVQVVIGAAGTGKTTALAAAAEAWTTSGHRVLGTALAARAAAELEAGAGIPSSTLAGLLAELEHFGQHLPEKAVVVADEAGMVGTRDLARLLDAAARDRAKVVLVGDPRQLPEIAAGGGFAALATHVGATHLSENRRQRRCFERRALGLLRAGRVHEALVSLRVRHHVITAASADEIRERLVGDWAASFLAGEDAVMLATRRSAVADLNARARRTLQDAGVLPGDEAVINGVGFATGDRVVALRNRRDLGVLNGTRGTAASVGERDVTLRLDDGGVVTLPREYLDDGHVAHGYATTVHKAQGMTCDRSFVLADDGLFLEAGYTALSRGRHSNRLYAAQSELDDDWQLERHHGRYRAIAILRSLRQSRAKEMAIGRDRGRDLGASW